MKYLVYTLMFVSISICENKHNRCALIESVRDNRPEMHASIVSDKGNFMIHYDTTGVRAPLDSEYVNEVAIAAEYGREILIDTLGYHPEIPDEDGIYDVYITNFNDGYYGVNIHEGNGVSYIKIDNDYQEGFYTSGLLVMRLTVAHEYFHAVQRWYKEVSGSEGYFFELSATWLEDLVVPEGDDYLYWVDDLFDNPEKDFDSFTSDTGYSLALYGHYLANMVEEVSHQFESTIIKEIWNGIKTGYTTLESLQIVLDEYDLSFADTWSDFMARNLYNGVYDNMDNDIYYYIDQSSPILDQYQISLINSNIFNRTVNFSINDRSVNIFSFNSYNGVSINLDHDILPSAGSIAIISNDSQNNRLIDVSNRNIVLDPTDIICFMYSSDQEEGDIKLSLSVNYSINQTKIFNVFPNPINYPGNEIVSLQVDYMNSIDNLIFDLFDVKGRMIKSAVLGNRTNGRKIEDLGFLLSDQTPNGVYLLRLNIDGEMHTTKFSISK